MRKYLPTDYTKQENGNSTDNKLLLKSNSLFFPTTVHNVYMILFRPRYRYLLDSISRFPTALRY